MLGYMFYLDEIKWQTGGDERYYHHPEMVFDCRSVPDTGTPNLTAGKFVLCEGPVASVGSVALGDLDHVLTLGERASVRSVLGWTPSRTVGDFIYQLVGPEADVTGLARCKPVRVGRKMGLRFKIGSLEYARRVNLADSDWTRTVQMERGYYAQWRAETLAGLRPAGHHLRCLDYLSKKYGRPHTDFLGKEPDEGVLPHQTTITETWGCADADSLNCDTTWTERVGDIDIVSNRARAITEDAANLAHTATALSSDAHYAQAGLFAGVSSGNQAPGVICRKADSATLTYLMYRLNRTTGTEVLQVHQVVTGTLTQLGSDSALTYSAGAVGKLSVNDSDAYTATYNGSETHTGTNTTGAGNLHTGIRGVYTIAGQIIEWDNFEAADLSAAGTIVLPHMMQHHRLYVSAR